MPKYRVVAGKHHVRQEDGSEVAYGQGCEKDVVELSVEEASKLTNKLVPVVEEAKPTPAAKPAPAAHAVAGPASTK